MLKSLKHLLMIIFFLGITNCLFASNHYIDKNATGNNNGTNWSNAWTSFSNIDWNSVQPGDIIYISGGNNSVTYNESLVVDKSGSSGNRITITKGTEPGHNGSVIISPNSGYGIEIDGKDYITVSKLEVKNPSGNAENNIRIDNCSFVTIDQMKLTPNKRGIFIQYCGNGIVISRNNIVTVENSSEQTDCIYSQRNREVTVWGNYLEVRNEDEGGHNDCFQSFEDCRDASNSNKNTLTFYNNILFQNNSKQNNSSALISTYGWGWFTYYNNIVIQPHSWCQGIGVQQNTTPGASNMKARIWNNTFIGGTSQNKAIYLRRMANQDTVDIANNIVYTSFPAASVKIDDSPNINIQRWEGNLYYSVNGSWNGDVVTGNDMGNYSLSEWQSAGYDLNGDVADPKFVDAQINSLGDYHLQSNSPAIDDGIDISEYFNFDKDGVTRPQGSGWDIGAYEFNNGEDLAPPKVMGAVAIDTSTVQVTFNEPIEENSAENNNNYSISGNIEVFNVVLSEDGKKVTIETSSHLFGNQYTLVVSNVTDLSGNIISETDNSATYELQPLQPGLTQFSVDEATANDWYQEYTPDKTIDGLGSNVPGSRWGGAIPMPDTLTFDLGSVRIISQLKISFYLWDQGRIYQYSLIGSINGTDWVNLASNVNSASEEWSVVDFNPVETRYIKLISLSSNQSEWAGVWEAEVFGIDGTVPVELASFSANLQNNKILLNWSTSSETNSSHFIIQRSFNNKNYETIGTVEGNGTSTKPRYYSFEDTDISSGKRYYRLKSVDYNGNSNYSEIVEVEPGKPLEFSLKQNYPNPFNPSTKIEFTTPVDQHIKLTVYNILGESVSELLNENLSAGKHQVDFDAKGLPSGIYIYRIESKDFIDVKKMTLLK